MTHSGHSNQPAAIREFVTIKGVELLGKSVTDVLPDAPFCDWPFKRSVDEDLDEPLVYFEFEDHGIAFSCRDTEIISTIFLSADGKAANVFELPTSLTRDEVCERFGRPNASGDGMVDPVLGTFGPYVRFDYPDHSAHFEFFPDQDKIKLITLMRPSVVPGR